MFALTVKKSSAAITFFTSIWFSVSYFGLAVFYIKAHEIELKLWNANMICSAWGLNEICIFHGTIDANEVLGKICITCTFTLS
jgi:hypothetical protein